MPPLATTLQSVTVYPDRARVTRRGAIALQAGPHCLEISELPTQLNPDSVRAAAHGTARARLLGVQVQPAFFAETPVEAVRELEAQIETLKDRLQQLDAQTELLRQNRAALQGLLGHTQIYATALAAGEMSIEQQQALFNGMRTQAGELEDELTRQAQNRRELERQAQKLQSDLDQRRNQRPRQRYTASVEVEVLEPGELTIELSYVIAGASWKPIYDLRLLEEQGPAALEVSYLAQVTQKTGEAWDNVALSLSTARPALAEKLPELNPWYLQPVAPVVMRQKAARGGAVFSLAASDAAAPPIQAAAAPQALMPVAAEEVHAQVDTSGSAVTYLVPGTASIPPDGTAQKVSVARFPLIPKLDYVATPKLVEAAYRRAKIVNESAYLLLPGAANLFDGDEFIGTTQLELTAPQGEIELYFGVDDQIKVERELKRRDVGKNLIGGKRRMQLGYEISLENLRPVEVKVTLNDQTPVSRHEEIKVRLESADPKPTEHSELNLLEWELTLAPKEKRTVRFDFSIEMPPQMQVMGLP